MLPLTSVSPSRQTTSTTDPTLNTTQHRLYRAYELVTSPMADDALRARYIINLCLATLALLALAVVINTFV